jgi:DNA mismatch endonuclease (patch repair protein)
MLGAQSPVRIRATPSGHVRPDVSARMRSVRQRDTAVELAVRSYLHQQGTRFRVCAAGLPGRPDVANRARGWALFVHGCFWHGHENCRLARQPRTNASFWEDKLRGNRERDARKEAELRRLGFAVYVVWQCWTQDPRTLARALAPIARTRARKSRAARGPKC